MAYTDVWDVTAPLDSQAASQGAADFRATKLDVMQRVASFGAGLLAARPTPETTGATADWTGVMYWATDTQQTFRWNGSSWDDITSSLFPGNPLTPVGFTPVDLLNQSTNITATTLYAIPVGKTGFYRISAALTVTTAGGASSTLPSLSMTWVDPNTLTTEALTLLNSYNGNALGGNALGSGFFGSMVVYAHTSSNIQYSTGGYASSGVPTMKYALHLRLEYLGA